MSADSRPPTPMDRLRQLREDVTNETYRVQSLEQCLQQAKDAVYALESMTVGSVFATLAGSRDRKLAARQTELRDVQDRYDHAVARLQSLARELESVEPLVASSPQAAHAENPSRADGSADDGRTDRRNAARAPAGDAPAMSTEERRRVLHAAIERGRTLMERLHSLTSATGRARNRSGAGRPLGALGAMAMDAVGAHGARAAVQRVQEGMRAFNDKVAEVEFSEGTELDLELIRLAAETRHFEAELGAHSVTQLVMLGAGEGPLLEHVQNFVGLLDAKLDQLASR